MALYHTFGELILLSGTSTLMLSVYLFTVLPVRCYLVPLIVLQISVCGFLDFYNQAYPDVLPKSFLVLNVIAASLGSGYMIWNAPRRREFELTLHTRRLLGVVVLGLGLIMPPIMHYTEQEAPIEELIFLFGGVIASVFDVRFFIVTVFMGLLLVIQFFHLLPFGKPDEHINLQLAVAVLLAVPIYGEFRFWAPEKGGGKKMEEAKPTVVEVEDESTTTEPAILSETFPSVEFSHETVSMEAEMRERSVPRQIFYTNQVCDLKKVQVVNVKIGDKNYYMETNNPLLCDLQDQEESSTSFSVSGLIVVPAEEMIQDPWPSRTPSRSITREEWEGQESSKERNVDGGGKNSQESSI